MWLAAVWMKSHHPEAIMPVARHVLVLVTAVALLIPSAAVGAKTRTASDPWSPDPSVGATLGRTSTPIDIEVSRHRFVDGSADHAVISRSDVFADALAGSPLTADGPLLFTARTRAPVGVMDELDRVLADGGRVYLLGGVVAIDESVATQLRDAGHDVVRLHGATRIETSLDVAEEVVRLYPDAATTVLIARSAGPAADPNGSAAWVDSVSAGAWAALERHPVVLTPTDGLDAGVAAFLDGRDTAIVLGGRVALSEDVAGQAAELVASVRRVEGETRSHTAAAVLTELWGAPVDAGRRTVIDGWSPRGWYDGLVVAGLAADFGAPVVLDRPGAPIDQGTATVMRRCGDKGIHALSTTGIDPANLEVLDGDTTSPACAVTPKPPRPPTTGADPITAVHLVPSDRDPVAGLSEAAAGELASVNQWFVDQAGNAGLDFARDAAGINVRVLQVDMPASELRSNPQVRAALDANGITGVAVVFIEAAGPACGSTGAGTSVMWMSVCNIYPSGNAFPYGGTYLAAHEIAHLLGAVPSCAPNRVDGGHVDDSNRDLLYSGRENRDWDNLVLDVGRDDYFGHGRSDCPDIADSPLWAG